MAGTLRKAWLSLAGLALLTGLVIGVSWWSIHTAWLANLVRDRLISTLRKATGAQIEIKSFSFDPDTLHVKIAGLVVHGTEPAGSPALLSIDSTDIGLKILSVWRQDVDVQSVSVNRPQIHLLVNADGSTNIPTPRRRRSRDPLEQLLDLKVKRFDVKEGLVQINDRKVPFQFTSQGIVLSLDYNHAGPSYGVNLKTEAVDFAVQDMKFKRMQVATTARLFKDHADVQQLRLTTDHASSTIELKGSVQHFAHPYSEGRVEASLSIDELAQLADINEQLRHGRATVSGSLRFDGPSGQFAFNGKTHASGVDLLLPVFKLRGMGGDADMLANNAGMLLRNAEAGARGAHFSGEGSIKGYRFLQVEGRVSNVALSEVGTYLTAQPFPWSGTAHGTAHASARLADKEPDFIIGAKVQIDPGATGIPTSGDVDVTFSERHLKVEFGDSNLRLPNSSASFNGTLDTDLSLKADTTSLADLEPLVPILGARLETADLPALENGGSAHFDGRLHDLMHQPVIQGDLAISKFKFRHDDWDAFKGQFALSANSLAIPQFQLQQSGASLTGNASAQLVNWSAASDSPVHLNARFANVNVVKTVAMFTGAAPPVVQGLASGNVNFQGTLDRPQGNGTVRIANLDAYGQQLNQIQLDAAVDGDRLQVSKGRIQSGPALLNFSGTYLHRPADWNAGEIDLRADTNGFPLASLSTIRKYLPALNARAEAHLQATGKISSDNFEPLKINGSADFSRVTLNGRQLGDASLKAVTQGSFIDFSYAGDLSETKFHGVAQARLTTGTPIRGDLQMERIGLSTLKALVTDAKLVLPLDGFVDGTVAFDGLLEEPRRLHALATIKDLQVSSLPAATPIAPSSVPDIILRNNEPVLIDFADGVLSVRKFEIDGKETSVKISGSAPLFGDKPIAIKAIGTADLALFSLFDPNVRSSGSSEIAVTITGPLDAPNVTGALQLRNGSFFLADIPNGLSDVNGTVVFGRNRATIQKMSARSGGGDLSLGGTLSFGEGSPLVYHLEGQARNVRVRYANSISVTANSDLRLSGTSASSILSGTLTVTRVVFTPNADAGSLLAAASSSTSSAADQGDFISGLHLDILVESAPNLQVSTNLSRDVEAEIQLRLRGTPDHPIVLGNITANQGDIKIFGTRFSLNRGDVSFVNTVRVEPVLDLDLETQARGITVDITVSGTPSKLNFNYRSDPPLQPRDIIALLTVGRAPEVGTTSNAQAGSDVSALKSGVNSVLGQAISPVSNRLSKLFGITNIKIDPFVQGITNTPQARLSVEQQISRDVTITYVTNLSQTSEQIFRFEWALNRQFSIVALRDDNGEFGIDFQYKKRFK